MMIQVSRIMGIPGFKWLWFQLFLVVGRGEVSPLRRPGASPLGPRLPAALPRLLCSGRQKTHFMDSLRETLCCRPHAPVPPVAPNVLAPGRLRWPFRLPIALRQTP